MSQNLTNPEQDRLGPVDCVVVEFPGGRVDAAGFQRLLDLVDRDVIRILDLEFLAKQPDGGVVAVPASELSSTSGFDVGLFDGAASNLLDRSDIDRIANDAGAGSIVAVLIYEERSLVPTPPIPSPAPTAAPATDVADQLGLLRQLGELRDAGVLTDAEFEVKKAKILQT